VVFSHNHQTSSLAARIDDGFLIHWFETGHM
jgi:hypothetical protein